MKDLDNHAYQAGNETISNVVDALDSVDELETDLDQSKESMYKLSYVIRVSAPDLDELKRRCDEVKDFYDDFNVKLVRPAGDMLGLHSEFLPASKRYINDYVQYVKSDFLTEVLDRQTAPHNIQVDCCRMTFHRQANRQKQKQGHL